MEPTNLLSSFKASNKYKMRIQTSFEILFVTVVNSKCVKISTDHQHV